MTETPGDDEFAGLEIVDEAEVPPEGRQDITNTGPGYYSREWRAMVRAIKQHDDILQRFRRYSLRLDQLQREARGWADLNARRIEQDRLTTIEDIGRLRQEVQGLANSMADFKASIMDTMESAIADARAVVKAAQKPNGD